MSGSATSSQHLRRLDDAREGDYKIVRVTPGSRMVTNAHSLRSTDALDPQRGAFR